jgi:glycosyltransferase involved in cell wall biosynthesis
LRGFGKIMSLPVAATYQEKFDQHKICVVIPTYNNEATVTGVINDVLQYTRNIVVVNDGSTDSTPQLLKDLAYIHLVSYVKNVGKGWALRQAFKAARQLGYDYAITIDSDGQHFASDLPLFVEKLATEGPAIIMGARNMQQESVPGKSSFGNKFSNFWFRVETGINCPDTQTGYRLYPIALLDKMRFFTRKYEFEIEVLVRSAWKGIKVKWIPIKVYYAPKEERISHFRPFKDFSRISVLNTVLVLITFLWIKPRDFFRKIFRNGNWWKNLNDQLSEPNETNARKAASVGFGVFMGIVPIWGFQLLVGIALAVLMRLNKVLFVIAANISIPPMIPLIIFLSYKAGAYWMGEKAVSLSFSEGISLQTIRLNLTQYLYGSITLALIAGVLFGLLTWGLLSLKRKKG